MVTFCSTVACGSILSTLPSKRRSGYASTVMVAGSPGLTLPMSVSSIRVRICTVSRFAMVKSTVPPPTSLVGEEITVPSSTFLLMMVPSTDARSRVSSIWSRAFSRSVCARTTCALAVTYDRRASSYSDSVMAWDLNNASERSSLVLVISS
jgi:hypothetical protein